MSHIESLNEQIARAAVSVSTDDFAMTIGEIANLYRDGDLIINPNFQRFFRWDIGRKSKLIESILLRIPIPPIFIFERQDTKWELIDGLQRVSTVLEFMGELKDPDKGGLFDPIILSGTEYLNNLSGAVWSEEFLAVDPDHAKFAFDGVLQRSLKRAKFGIQLLEKKSDEKSKFDLFQRLNSGGLSANPQEIRNCAIIMSNEKFFKKLSTLTQDVNFQNMVPLGPLSIKKANNYEHISRIVAFGFRKYDFGVDIEDFVNRALIEISTDENEQFHDFIVSRVKEVFQLITDSIGRNGLRPYVDGNFRGRIGRTSIEIVFLGILFNFERIVNLEDPNGFITERTKAFWLSGHAEDFTAAGVSGTDRVYRTIPFGQRWFDPENDISN